MNISASIEVNNRDAVKDASREAVMRALEAIGAQAVNYATNLCPVDTGRLKNSLTHVLEGDDTVCVGTNVEYAAYVELGHHLPGGKWVEPKPYLEPAITNHAEEYKQMAEEYLKSGG